MNDPAVFIDFVINTLGVIIQQTVFVITDFVELFGDLLAMKFGYIDTFIRYTYSVNNAIVAVQIILIKNNVTQGLKFMFLSK